MIPHVDNSLAASPFDAGMDTILAGDEWLTWRSSHSTEPAILAAGARAWCTSKFWQYHTPRLEQWKLTLSDLRTRALCEDDIEQMALANSSRVCFPLIPLFEHEQLSDFFPLVGNVMMAARLAEQLIRVSMLSLKSEDVPRMCWELMAASHKRGWEFTAWRWLIFPQDFEGKVWPSEDGIRAIYCAGGQRAAAAALLLEQIAGERSLPGVADSGAASVLAALSKLRQLPALVEVPPPAERASPNFDQYAPDASAITHAGESTISAEYRSLYRELFSDPPDVSRWKAVEEDTRLRGANSHTLPPLSAMARDLGQSEIPSGDDQNGWQNLVALLRECPQLMKADSSDPGSPLPALEFAATVRSTVPIGKVAVELLLLAPSSERQNPDWWRAFKAGLKPVIRRGGWALANDRANRAISVVAFQTRWMSQAEQQAMKTVFIKDQA